MGLGHAHGVERGHGTARERGESGAEGAGAGKKKERRRETLTSGPHLSERERASASGSGLRAGLLGLEERWAAWGVEAGPRGGVLGRPKKRVGGRVGPPGCAGLKMCFLFS